MAHACNAKHPELGFSCRLPVGHRGNHNAILEWKEPTPQPVTLGAEDVTPTVPGTREIARKRWKLFA